MKIVWFKDTDDNILNIVSKSGASHSSYSSPLNPGAGEKVNEKGNLDMLVTLDGFFEYSNNELRSMDAILYERVAYQKTGHQNVDELGPETESTIEFVNNVNNIKKVVFSRTLEKVEDNAKILREINAEEISKMKQEPKVLYLSIYPKYENYQ